jgi:hypothetical protein
VYQHDTYAGISDTVHTSLSVEDAAALRQDRQSGSFTVTIGNVDLPAYLSSGVLYLQAPLGLFIEAFAEDLPAFLRDMEVRISDARGAAFSLNCDGRPVSLAGLAEPRVVSNRWWRR